jgi:hypothetical protein
VLALCAPLLVPGLHPSKLFSSGPGLGGTGEGTGGSTPGLPGVLSQTIADQRDKHPSAVFSYTTTALQSLQSNDPQYFRQYVSDTLTGDLGWMLSGYAAEANRIGTLPAPQGLMDPSSAEQVTTMVPPANSGATARCRSSCPCLIRPQRSPCRRESGW